MRPKIKIERLYLTLTNECNMRCPHCWISAGDIHDERDVSFGEYKKTIDALLNYGLKTVKITGGEPLIKKDLVKSLLTYCNDKGVRFNVETNGLLIDDEYLELFKKSPNIEIGISLDYPNENHDKFRKYPNAFKIIKSTLTKLYENRVNTCVIMTVHKDNYSYMHDVADLVINQLGGHFIKYLVCHDSGRAKNEMQDNLLGPSEIIDFYNKVSDIADLYPKKVTAMIPTAFQRLNSDIIIGKCDVGSIISVLPDGSIALCGVGITNPETILGEISSDSITEIVENNSNLKSLRNHKNNYTGICGSCMFLNVCANICPASSYSNYGTYFGPYPICQSIYEAGLFPNEYIVEEIVV